MGRLVEANAAGGPQSTLTRDRGDELRPLQLWVSWKQHETREIDGVQAIGRRHQCQAAHRDRLLLSRSASSDAGKGGRAERTAISSSDWKWPRARWRECACRDRVRGQKVGSLGISHFDAKVGVALIVSRNSSTAMSRASEISSEGAADAFRHTTSGLGQGKRAGRRSNKARFNSFSRSREPAGTAAWVTPSSSAATRKFRWQAATSARRPLAAEGGKAGLSCE